jgi:hypothetical protein
MYGERLISLIAHPSAATMKTAPKIVTREIVLVLRWKIWGMFPPLPHLLPELPRRKP